MAPQVYMSIGNIGEGLHIDETTYQIGNVDINGNFSLDFNINTDSDIVSGTTFHLDLSLNTGAYSTNFDYSFAVGVAIETFESGDFSFLEWEHTGDQHWFITDEEAHSGTYCARSGEIADDEASYLLVYADILLDGEISFWFKTSTEGHKDYFAFFIDGRKKDWWSGENDWTYASYQFEAGSHVFKWIYDKNRSGSSGQDCAWIDDITFPRTCYITKVEEFVKPNANAIYPNPTTDNVTIQLAEESNVCIFNAMGQMVKRLDKVSGHQLVDFSDAPKGLYYVQIQSGSNLETQKLIVD